MNFGAFRFSTFLFKTLYLFAYFKPLFPHFSFSLTEYKIWEQFTTDGYSAAQRLDALRSSHPVIVPIKHAEEVDQVFDAISYCKGSTVVRMVEAILGELKFQYLCLFIVDDSWFAQIAVNCSSEIAA